MTVSVNVNKMNVVGVPGGVVGISKPKTKHSLSEWLLLFITIRIK